MRSTNFFRNAARLEEQMIRAAMPRTSENDPTPLRFDANRLRQEPKPTKSGFSFAQVARVEAK